MEVIEYELQEYRNSLRINAATEFGDNRFSGIHPLAITKIVENTLLPFSIF